MLDKEIKQSISALYDLGGIFTQIPAGKKQPRGRWLAWQRPRPKAIIDWLESDPANRVGLAPGSIGLQVQDADKPDCPVVEGYLLRTQSSSRHPDKSHYWWPEPPVAYGNLPQLPERRYDLIHYQNLAIHVEDLPDILAIASPVYGWLDGARLLDQLRHWPATPYSRRRAAIQQSRGKRMLLERFTPYTRYHLYLQALAGYYGELEQEFPDTHTYTCPGFPVRDPQPHRQPTRTSRLPMLRGMSRQEVLDWIGQATGGHWRLLEARTAWVMNWWREDLQGEPGPAMDRLMHRLMDALPGHVDRGIHEDWWVRDKPGFLRWLENYLIRQKANQKKFNLARDRVWRELDTDLRDKRVRSNGELMGAAGVSANTLIKHKKAWEREMGERYGWWW